MTDHGKKTCDAGRRCHAACCAGGIGSGLGIRNPYNMKIIIEQATVPIIVDAGVGTASMLPLPWSLAVIAVLLNTGDSRSKGPESPWQRP